MREPHAKLDLQGLPFHVMVTWKDLWEKTMNWLKFGAEWMEN